MPFEDLASLGIFFYFSGPVRAKEQEEYPSQHTVGLVPREKSLGLERVQELPTVSHSPTPFVL